MSASVMSRSYVGVPYRAGGRSFEGADCAGLAWLWLREEMGFAGELQSGIRHDAEEALRGAILKWNGFARGDLLFFGRRPGRVSHVAVCLGNGRLLTTDIFGSKVINGTELLDRAGLKFEGAIGPDQAEAVCAALSNSEVGWTAVIGLVISVVLSFAAAALTPKPKLPEMRNQSGRYGFQGLQTMTSSEVPLPIVLGRVTLAGNAIFQSPIDKAQAVTGAHPAAVTRVIVWASGPATGMVNLRANGIYRTSQALGFNSADPNHSGMQVAAQTKAEAWTGTFSFGNYFSSFNNYLGATVPAVDVRASYDRFMPIYGLNGCCFTAFRCMSSHFPNGLLNMTQDISGMAFRTFTTAGFDRSSTSTTFTGDGTTTQFKLFNDVENFTSITVGGVAYTELSESNLSGNVYHLNRERGILTFLSAPAVAASIAVTYNYFPRAWSQNPVAHIVFLLTDTRRGKGWDESRIDWVAAVDTRDYCDASTTWRTSDGYVTQARYLCNYVIDVRKPMQAHLAEILNAFYGYMVLSEGKIKIRARRTGSSQLSFDTTNILEVPEFKSKLIDRSARANRVRCFFHTKDTLNAETETVRDDDGDQRDREPRIGNRGVVEDTLRFAAVDNLSQAERLGEQILRENIQAKWLVEFATSIKGLALEPGDIVDVTHPSQPSWTQKLFRIESIVLDEGDNPTLTCSEYCDCAYI